MDAIFSVFDANQEFLTSWTPAIIGIALYIVTVIGGKIYMAKREPFDWRTGLKYHNLILFIMSVGMLLGAIYETYRAFIEYNPLDVFCSSSTYKGGYTLRTGGFFWSYLFYLSKFYEFGDTLFIVFRKKPLIFLHFYHHIVVVPLSLSFIRHGMFFYINGVIANALIHSFMYWSYYRTSIGKPPSWKKYLTRAQMVQFVWGMGTMFLWPPVCGYKLTDVTGPMGVVWFNQLVLISFLFLFKTFYSRRYNVNSKQASSKDKKE